MNRQLFSVYKFIIAYIYMCEVLCVPIQKTCAHTAVSLEQNVQFAFIFKVQLNPCYVSGQVIIIISLIMQINYAPLLVFGQ